MIKGVSTGRVCGYHVVVLFSTHSAQVAGQRPSHPSPDVVFFTMLFVVHSNRIHVLPQLRHFLSCAHMWRRACFFCAAKKTKRPQRTRRPYERFHPRSQIGWLTPNGHWRGSLVGQKCPNRHELNGKRGPQHPTPWGPKHPQCSVFRLAGATNSCWHSGTV